MSQSRPRTTDGEEGVPPARAAADRIERRGAEIRDRQVERALSCLAEQGDLTPEKRAAVERVAARITEHLLDQPTTALRETDDEETVALALSLFGE